MPLPESAPGRAYPVLLYDGVCGLCNGMVKFVLLRDPSARIRFASLQSDYAARILQPRGIDSRDLNTIYFMDRSGEQIMARSSAVISILRELGGPWRVLAAALSIFPKPLREWGYRVVARDRYRLFGRHETCVLPEQKYQNRFLDL